MLVDETFFPLDAVLSRGGVLANPRV
jgi:hypothetical protein